MKKILTLVGPLAVIVSLFYFLPKLAIFYFLFGTYDVLRNQALSFATLKRYFFGNGILTWLLSPFNTLLDLLALPYINKGIYQLEDLPPAYQVEVKRLIEAAHREDLVRQLKERTKDQSRSMVFFKWYGANVDTFVDVPAFHEPYKFIQTIGVSVFNKRQSTSKHFGPFRATLRVLYNINNVESKDAYIEVGDVIHRWRDEKLFIFDDTLQHQSFNQTDGERYCLF
ncbi:MAG: aspartyl/asparaginyl beta-hydroxylase domain-containing protein, partial [Armatimonadota bacterium]